MVTNSRMQDLKIDENIIKSNIFHVTSSIKQLFRKNNMQVKYAEEIFHADLCNKTS